ncbi:MAG: hypothetical protein K2H16_10100 [Prevotella sp.]|nr:hypothetical protein [Prevotella sp.]MDE6152457.1 hypothetical protein [Prevotella sp.]
MEESSKTYYMEINGSKAYFHYDESTQEFKSGGNAVTISKERFNDFISTARVLGFKAGEL